MFHCAQQRGAYSSLPFRQTLKYTLTNSRCAMFQESQSFMMQYESQTWSYHIIMSIFMVRQLIMMSKPHNANESYMKELLDSVLHVILEKNCSIPD